MKRINSILWGLVLIAISGVLALNAFGITNINIFFDFSPSLYDGIRNPCPITEIFPLPLSPVAYPYDLMVFGVYMPHESASA